MKKENKKKKQKKGSRGKKNSVQELLGIRHFTKYGLMTEHGELVFFQIAPTNISVLSYDNIERENQPSAGADFHASGSGNRVYGFLRVL